MRTMPHDMAGWLDYLRLVAPGLALTGWLVLAATVALLALLTHAAWAAAEQHDEQAREQAEAQVCETPVATCGESDATR